MSEYKHGRWKTGMKVTCPYCDKPANLVTGAAIYPHRKDLHKQYFWFCQPCNAYVGTHKNSKAFAPLGRLANAELRAAKIEAHNAFDPLWKSREMSRRDAYQWLAKRLCMSVKKCHIGMFDVDMCNKVVEVMQKRKEA